MYVELHCPRSAKDQSYQGEKLGTLDKRSDQNVKVLQNMFDEEDAHSLECDKVYDLYEYLLNIQGNLRAKHFLRTAK